MAKQWYPLLTKIALLVYCLIIALQSSGGEGTVLSLFIATAFSFGVQNVKDARLKCVCIAAFFLTPFALGPCLFFIPLLVMDAVYLLVSQVSAFALVPLLLLRPGTREALLLLPGAVFAVLFALSARWIEELSKAVLKTRDAAEGETLTLRRENKALADRQDAELYAATLKERNRIAREIHDNVGHLLTRSILMVGALRTVNQDAALAEPLSQIDTALNEAMNEVRKSVHDLHDDSVDLEASAGIIVNAFTFCPVSFDYSCGRDVPADVKYCFLAVLKEALSNVAKHSGATRVRVSMVEHPAMYRLTIEDNGTVRKYTDEDGAEPDEGIGLSNMRARVKALNGTIRFSEEDGFRIFISIPA